MSESKEKAIDLIRRLVVAEIETCKAANTGRGISQAKEKEETRAAAALFSALTGEKPNQSELNMMLSY